MAKATTTKKTVTKKTATKKAPVKKKAPAKKTPVAKKTTKVANKTTPKKATSTRGPSVRERILLFIAENGESSAREVQLGIGLSHGCKPTCDQEVTFGHLTAETHPTENGGEGPAMYKITKEGKKKITQIKKGNEYNLRGSKEESK